MRVTLSLAEDLERTSVERAVAELRMGRPVLLESFDGSALIHGVEDLSAERAMQLDAIAGAGARLVLPAARLKRLGLDRSANGTVALPTIDCDRVATLAFSIGARIDAPVRAASALDEDALELARLALSLPAVIVLPIATRSIDIDPSVLRVASQAIRGFRAPGRATCASSDARPCRSTGRRRRNSWCSGAARACATRSRSWSAGRTSRSRCWCACTRPA
jgi:GTP cyclohydrolase II